MLLFYHSQLNHSKLELTYKSLLKGGLQPGVGGQKMFPNEIAILRAVKKNNELGLQQLTHVTDISGAYLRYICNSLSLRGYLKSDNLKGYQATPKARKAISDALRETKV